jgi:putative membrane protein
MNDPLPTSPDVQSELARERNHIAADRSLLSFVRNGLTLISIGFGIDRVVQAISPGALHTAGLAYISSLVFIGLGVFTVIGAARDYQQELKRLKQPDYYFTPRWSLSGVIGVAILIVGIVAFVWIAAKLLA